MTAPDAQAIFRRHFEARFAPLPASARQEEVQQEEQEEEWAGLSDDAVDDDEQEQEQEEQHTVQVVDYSSAPAPPPSMTKRELKAFLSSLPPTTTTQSVPQTSSPAPLPEDAPSLLANDLALRRLLSESHLLAPSTTSDTPFASGRTRHKATELRLRALGAHSALDAQPRMPMKMRKGIVAAAANREEKRRRAARENGVVLEREVKIAKGGNRRSRRGEAEAPRPGVGRLRGAELRISEGGVRKIEGQRDTFGRRR